MTQAVACFSSQDIIFAEVPRSLQKELLGKSLAQVAWVRGVTVQTLVAQLKEEHILVELKETGGERALTSLPLFCWQAVYPRGSSRRGPLPYLDFLQEKDGPLGNLPLEVRVQKFTFLPACILRLRGRGMIAPDYFADLLVVKARQEGSCSLEYVFVNGRPVLKNGQLTKIKSGQLCRGD